MLRESIWISKVGVRFLQAIKFMITDHILSYYAGLWTLVQTYELTNMNMIWDPVLDMYLLCYYFIFTKNKTQVLKGLVIPELVSPLMMKMTTKAKRDKEGKHSF